MWHATPSISVPIAAGASLNLYSYDLGSKQVEQLTHFTDST